MKKTIIFLLCTTISLSIFAIGKPIPSKSKILINEVNLTKSNKSEANDKSVDCRIITRGSVNYQCGPGVVIQVATTITVTTVNCTTGAILVGPVTTHTETGNTCPNTVMYDVDSNP